VPDLALEQKKTLTTARRFLTDPAEVVHTLIVHSSLSTNALVMDSQPVEDTRRTHQVSVCCGCCACFFITNHIATNSLLVTWFWEHSHDPNSVSDMVNGQISLQVNKWLTDQVDSGMMWPNISRLIKIPDILNVSFVYNCFQ
jgi:hypothetical protein